MRGLLGDDPRAVREDPLPDPGRSVRCHAIGVPLGGPDRPAGKDSGASTIIQMMPLHGSVPLVDSGVGGACDPTGRMAGRMADRT